MDNFFKKDWFFLVMPNYLGFFNYAAKVDLYEWDT